MSESRWVDAWQNRFDNRWATGQHRGLEAGQGPAPPRTTTDTRIMEKSGDVNRTLKYRRDEVAKALALTERRWGGHDEWVNVTLTEVARILGLEDYSEIAADYNTPGEEATSQLAALINLPKSGSQREQVFLALAVQPLADQEIEARLSIPRSSASTRRAELVAGGWVEATDERRRTEADNEAIVWRLTEKGLKETNQALF